ncbi:hypothetical protein [Rosistilla oblonga]|uniref:hypothetical protein n=1 Tax=Rosistilla oblonga TaxID=2527990 RepID=UPI003A972C59
MKTIFQRSCLLLGLALATCATADAQGRTRARLFWQDDADATVRYGDLKRQGNDYTLEAKTIDGFPALDVAEQSLVQMQADSGLILIGVRDQADGTIGSGWVAIESGGVEEPHGDHSHWKFPSAPSVLRSVIDTEQGNPAHLYHYGRSFVLANDKSSGMTITTAQRLRDPKPSADRTTFVLGGGGHITLAIAEDHVAYSTWIDRSGENSGRVDVVGLGSNNGKRYEIRCPSGGLHGATINEGKVFLAPADGVCWVPADMQMTGSADDVEVKHLAIGKGSEDKPLRTGAFANLKNHVLFTAGKEADCRLCWIDASSPSPAISTLLIPLDEAEGLSTPVVVETRDRRKLALTFAENRSDSSKDRLIVVDLDPNDDGNFSDAKQVQSIAVGPNQIEGHSGHHTVTVLPGRRQVALTNPGEGSIWIVSLTDFKVAAKFEVPGTPTRLIALGG